MTSPPTLDTILRSLHSELRAVSHDIHAHPELGGEERYAQGRLIEVVSSHGFAVESPVCGLETAFLARRAHGRSRPRIAFLAEYDALPGLGHGCGHNWIAAASLGAAIALAKLAEEQELSGEILLLGTPGEESLGGKVIMTDGGLFDDIDVAMMVHPSRRTVVDRTSLASCPLEIEFRGRASHAVTSPESGINALDAARLTFTAVDLLAKTLRADARTPGIIRDGGRAPNTIPDHAVLRFTLRAADSTYLEHLKTRVLECAQGASIATRASMSWRIYEPRYEALRSNPVLVRLFREELARLGLEETTTETKGSGSLDIGNVSQRIPAIHPDLKIAPHDVNVHTPAFREAAISPQADARLLEAASALAGTGLRLLREPALMNEATTSHPEDRGVPR